MFIDSEEWAKEMKRNLLEEVDRFSESLPDTIDEVLETGSIRQVNSYLKQKIRCYYMASHSGFLSLSQKWNGQPILKYSSQVSEARRDFKVKPASWFPLQDVCDIYEILKRRFDISGVLDPFSGWGTRAAGALICGLKYYGCDFNRLLVHELLNIFVNYLSKDFSLVWGDSFQKDFSFYQGKADIVFSCPPYWLAEQYGYEMGLGEYKDFLNKMLLITNALLPMVKAVVWSLEDFNYCGRKYSFLKDFTLLAFENGIICERYCYRKMQRSFNKDERELFCLILTRC